MFLQNSVDIERRSGKLWRTISELGALVFVFYLWMLSQSALAEDSVASEQQSTLWLEVRERPEPEAQGNDFSKQQNQGFYALQLETDVSIQINGPISRVKVRQVFNNPSQFWVEGQYSYPLPESASVDRLRMHIGERIIEGEVQEKQQAAKTFAQARSEGKKASLLSHQRANQFRTQVTNIAPGEQVIVEFEYQQWLDFRNGQYDLRFPMVSTPPYTPSLGEGSIATLDKDFVAPDIHYRSHHDKPGNPVSIHLDLAAGLPISAPVSESHPVNVKQLDESHYQIDLQGNTELSDRDFLLSWRPEASAQPRVSVLEEEINGEHYGLLMIMPPQEDFLSDTASSRELVLVIDVSGSMQGPSIKQAKAALMRALEQLEEDDLFNLIWFNNRPDSLFPVSQKASARNLALARHKVSSLKADGGTNMLPALKNALQFSDNELHLASTDQNTSVLRQVVFITDGAVSNEAELFTMIRQQLGHSRLFTVGIGSAPNSYFMRKAARAGRGSFTYINKPEYVEEKIADLFSKLRSPAMTDLKIDFQGYDTEIFPQPIPDLYLGEPLYIAFKSEDSPEYATVSGNIDGRHMYTNHELRKIENEEVREPSSSQQGIATEWARRKVEHLLERHRESNSQEQNLIQARVTQLGLAHQLVSKYTSLVVVDSNPVRAGDNLVNKKIPSNLPAGWAIGKTQSIQLAQTASGVWLKIYSGLSAFVLALVLLLLSRRFSERSKGLTS